MKLQNALIMKTTILTLMFSLCILSITNAQVKYHTKDDIKLVVSGTSTLHDWDMKSAKGECNALFTFNAAGQLATLTALTFITPAEGLKSEHSGMDKNAYKALKTDKNVNISYTLTSATVYTDGTVKCIGKLTIAGATLDVDFAATCKPSADKTSITVTGSKKLSMKDFKIDPPTFMMGTIKTGNDIVLKFTLTLKK